VNGGARQDSPRRITAHPILERVNSGARQDSPRRITAHPILERVNSGVRLKDRTRRSTAHLSLKERKVERGMMYEWLNQAS